MTTAEGEIVISGGGAGISGAGVGEVHPAALDSEYRSLYAQFAALIAAGQGDVDLAPLRLVADAFLLAEQVATDRFDW